MPFELVSPKDVEHKIVAALGLILNCRVTSEEFIAGAMVIARHQAQAFGLDWANIELKVGIDKPAILRYTANR